MSQLFHLFSIIHLCFLKSVFLGKQTQDLQQNCIPLGRSSREQQLINLKLGFTSYNCSKKTYSAEYLS